MRKSSKLLRDHRELEVYQKACEAAMLIFQKNKTFPSEERYSPTDPIRRSSRSVCSNLSEAWRKRRYQAAFVAKLSDAEAAETHTWLDFAHACTTFPNIAETNSVKATTQSSARLWS